MSYELYALIVFESSRAPRNPNSFLKWYEQQIAWPEKHSYMPPSATSPALRNGFMEFKEIFPQMNGPFAPGEDKLHAMNEAGTDSYITDYSIGRDIIYAAFAYPLANTACQTAHEPAFKH